MVFLIAPSKSMSPAPEDPDDSLQVCQLQAKLVCQERELTRRSQATPPLPETLEEEPVPKESQPPSLRAGISEGMQNGFRGRGHIGLPPDKRRPPRKLGNTRGMSGLEKEGQLTVWREVVPGSHLIPEGGANLSSSSGRVPVGALARRHLPDRDFKETRDGHVIPCVAINNVEISAHCA